MALGNEVHTFARMRTRRADPRTGRERDKHLPSKGEESDSPRLWLAASRTLTCHTGRGSQAFRAALIALSLASLVVVSSCQREPFTPTNIPSGQAAVFGRVNVTNQGAPVNYACALHFKDVAARPNNHSPDLSANAGDASDTRVPLDATGWVFDTLRVGATYRVSIACELGTAQYLVSYSPKPFVFRPLGGNTISYFGDFVVELHVDMQLNGIHRVAVDESEKAFGLIGGALAQVIVSSGKGDDAEYTLYDLFSDARLVYDARYAQRASALNPVSVLDKRFVTGVTAFQSSSKGALDGHGKTGPASAAPPEPDAITPIPGSLGGLAFGKTLEELEAACVVAGHSFSARSTEEASCSGAPGGDLQEVVLTVWLEGNRSVRIDVSASTAMGWQQRIEQHTQLTQRFRQFYGNLYSRKTKRLDGCERRLADCLRQGQAQTTIRWRWSDGRTVSLTLDPRSMPRVAPSVPSSASSEPSTGDSIDAAMLPL